VVANDGDEVSRVVVVEQEASATAGGLRTSSQQGTSVVARSPVTGAVHRGKDAPLIEPMRRRSWQDVNAYPTSYSVGRFG
jgi:hypothetical protein